MASTTVRGRVYRCPVCGAQVAVVGAQMGQFSPRCCNVAMDPWLTRLQFYVCHVCGAEIGVVGSHGANFHPRCCNTNMLLDAA